MPGIVTTQEDLADAWNVKLGKNDDYSKYGLAGSGAANTTLEKAIERALLSEASTAAGIDDFKSYTSLTTNTTTHQVRQIASGDVQALPVDYIHRNAVVVADYLSNVDTSGYASAASTVAIKSAGPLQAAPTFIKDDSAAFENATVKFTITDPYLTSPTFSDSTTTYTGTFNTATTGAKNYQYTRNVNANSAHTDELPSITATEHTNWNTRSDPYGPGFVNGYVSLDATTYAPSVTLYGLNTSQNILDPANGNFVVDYVAGTPQVGRYALVFTNNATATAGELVPIVSNNMQDLVVVADVTDYNNFVGDPINTPVPLIQLPIVGDLNPTNLQNYLPVDNSSVKSGFLFEITGPEGGTVGEFLVKNTSKEGFVGAPISIVAENMSFSLANKYLLEKSVDPVGEHDLLESVTVSGVASPVINKLVVTNGSLTLSGDDSSKFTIVDGDSETLTSAQGVTNGTIDVYNSDPVSAYNTSEGVFPRAAGGSASVFSNCAVNYVNTETSYKAGVGVLSESAKTTDRSYEITTLAAQTTSADPVITNKIGVSNKAIAFVNQLNNVIAATDISFNNSNAETAANELVVVDFICQGNWQEGSLYTKDESNVVTPITNIVVDIAASNVNMSGIVDLRTVLNINDLTTLNLYTNLNSDGWGLSYASGTTSLQTSLDKQGIFDSELIANYINVNESEGYNMSFHVTFNKAEIGAHRYNEGVFYNVVDIGYPNIDEDGLSIENLTYRLLNTDFTITSTNETETPVLLPQGNYTGIPAGHTLYQITRTENIAISAPLLFGNYSNIVLTTPTFTQTTTYYQLKYSDSIVPNSFLKDIKLTTGNLGIKATISLAGLSLVGAVFKASDFTSFSATLQRQQVLGGEWTDVAGGFVGVDLFANIPSTMVSTIGSFTYSFTTTGTTTLAGAGGQQVYIDMSLKAGTSHTIVGKRFTAAQVDALVTSYLSSEFDLAAATGTPMTGLTVDYVPGDTAGGVVGTATLSGGGYTFEYPNNLIANIRVISCPVGMFKVVRTVGVVEGVPAYPTITDYSTALPYLRLDDGVYVYGGLTTSVAGDTATWTLLNDAIRINYWTGYGGDYARVVSVGQIHEAAGGVARRIINTLVRGYTANSTVTMLRIGASAVLQSAGYQTASFDLHTDIYYDEIFGGLYITASQLRSMYANSITELTFLLSINYGTYTIVDRAESGAESVTSYVPAYKTVISNRYGVKIISTSLSIRDEAQYRITYATDETLNVYYISGDAGIISQSTSKGNFPATPVASFSVNDLKTTGQVNLVGGVLNFHFTSETNIPALECFFTIAPAFLKFQAIDPSSVTSVPFVQSGVTKVTRYAYVNHATGGVQTFNPFSNVTNMNNISIATAVRTFDQYKDTSSSTVYGLDIGTNVLTIEYASGFDTVPTYSTVIENEPIPVAPVTAYLDGKVQISSFADGTCEIAMNQNKISTTSPVIFTGVPPGSPLGDESDYNLLVQLGSHLLAPPPVVLKFNAGDCTGLTFYGIDTMSIAESTLTVALSKYTNTAGINSDLFTAEVRNGLRINATNKYVKLYYTSAVSTITGSAAKLTDMLADIRSQITNSSLGWTDSGSNSEELLWLKPNNENGKSVLSNAFLVNKNIPRSIHVVQLQDAFRLQDNAGVPVYRVTYGGKVFSSYGSAVGVGPVIADLGTNLINGQRLNPTETGAE